MPIMLNRFCEHVQMEENSKFSDKNNQFTALLRINRICRTFDDFLKYFPKAVVLEDTKTFVTKLQAFNNKFYFQFKIVSKNEAILRIIPHDKK